jgi:transposase
VILFPRETREQIMQGEDERSGSLFSYVDLEARIDQNHPLRMIRMIVKEALAALAGDFFGAVFADGTTVDCAGEAVASDAPASVLFDPPGQLTERLDFGLLFRWFVGIGVDDAAWDHSTFSKNRDRLLEGDIAARLLSGVLAQPRVKPLLSTDHFLVDGTLIEAWASMKSFKPIRGRAASR